MGRTGQRLPEGTGQGKEENNQWEQSRSSERKSEKATVAHALGTDITN